MKGDGYMFNRNKEAIEIIKDEIADYELKIITYEQALKKETCKTLIDCFNEQITLLKNSIQALEKTLTKL